MQGSCILHFDGTLNGNPGIAGAGAVLRADDGRLIGEIREGLGVVINNVAEYQAVILGLNCAHKKMVLQAFLSKPTPNSCVCRFRVYGR
ncbi:hypothetical protein ACFX1R_044566 [Malus domestica]